MELDKGMKTALAAAQELRQERQAIADAIKLTEQLFQASIERLLAAESSLFEIEASSALGKADQHQLTLARKHLAQVREELDGIAARLAGLRSRLQSQGVRLAENRDTMRTLTSDHAERITIDFREEWSGACTTFGRTMAKRAAIEQTIGQALDLLPPTASSEPIDLGELEAPFEVLRSLEVAIGEIGQGRRMEARDRVRTPVTFDPDAIYVFRSELRMNGKLWRAGDRCLGAVLGAASAKFAIDRRALVRVDLQAVAG